VEGLRSANHQMEARVRERTRELEGLTRELSLRDELRGRLLRKVISAQEDERKRIARELHDETCQTIAALALRLDAAKSGPTPEENLARIDEAMAMATRSLDELHRIIFDLRPSILDDLGLLPAIRWIAQRHLAPNGIQVRCEFDGMALKLPPETEIAVFRAVQEAFSNIVRHARADTVLVEASEAAGILEIAIEDDGMGFDVGAVGGPSASGRGLGLLGIRERLELIGGTATVDSSPGSGTRVVLRIPVPQ
jgi:signal transduction histidine kinase